MFKRTLNILVLLIIPALSLTSISINAEQASSIRMKNPKTDEARPTMTIEQKAKMWNLTTDEYKKYIKEMASTPSSKWWKDLDPPQVLGQNATTEEERMKYADIDVRLDQERASREIAFQHAYKKAFSRQYPNAKLISIDTDSSHKKMNVIMNDDFFLFTPINDPEGALLAGKIINIMRIKNEISLNIFFVGPVSSEQIQRWGKNNNIPRHMRHGDKVTLNHNSRDGTSKLENLVGSVDVALPLLVRVRNGKSQTLSLMSL